MQVRDIMTASVDSIEVTESIADAARRMADKDVGCLPVMAGDKLVGIVTDRDLAIRGLGAGLHPACSVLRVMTEEVEICRPDDQVDDVLKAMAEEQVRRVPVCTEEGELVGMVTLADVARYDRAEKDEVSEALALICHPSGHHSQVSNAA